MMDSSQVGRFGTLSVMKTSDPTVPVAHFPIDEEEITIGRDPSCSVRLYYETVSRLHCKIVFQERKAFLVVLGASGLMTDGCGIFPTSSGPTTVPLANDTEIEVHRKKFRFTYPPKELRASILSTPEPERSRRRKTLRMSMIQSAQVFSPAPSSDPRENLRTLQSPLKQKFQSPLKPSAIQEEEEDEDVVLVDGNQPSVVQDEDDDLVILESVQAAQPPPPTPARVVQFAPQPHQYQTPRRKPRSSLHRAVLIRSAQRNAMRHEAENVETQEQEQMEVEEVAVPEEEPAQEAEEEMLEEEEDQPQPLRQLGNFMTPQVTRIAADEDRLAQSVEGPRRVRVVQPWKVRDIIIPEVKREDFAPVFRKERISEEEKKAIRDRRKSALTAPDPFDAHIPGSKRLSAVVPPSPRVFTSPSKEDSKAGIREEDTAVLFERMKAMVEDMKRKKSIVPSPAKADTEDEAKFWGAADQEQEQDDMLVDDEELAYPAEVMEEESDDEAEEAEVIRQTTPVRELAKTGAPPKTPRMDGVRNMFAEPTAPTSTPVYAGMKQMFSQAAVQNTPKMDGLRGIFATREEPLTPTMEGISDLLATPAGFHQGAAYAEGSDEEAEVPKKGPTVVKKRKVAPKTAAASPEPEAGPAMGARKTLRQPTKVTKATTLPKQTRTRSAPTEDEVAKAKPVPRSEPPRKTKSADVAPVEASKTVRRPVRKAPEPAASIPKPVATRPTRTRAAQESGSEEESVPVATTSKIPPVRRATRAKPVPAGEPSGSGAKTKRAVGRGKAVKEEDEASPLEAAKKPASRSKVASKAETAKGGKENTPDLDEEESGESAPPASRTRRGVKTTPAVKDEPKEVKVAPRTRVTRSKK